MKDEIRALADRYAAELKRNIDERVGDMGRCVLQVSGINYVEVTNEAAFYGPKRIG